MKSMNNAQDLLQSLPRNLQEYITKLKEKADAEEGYMKSVMAGYCPNCASDRTIDGYNAPLNDITVGICLDCHTLWCLECGEVLDKGKTVCGHWAICDKCAIETDGGCEFPPFDCTIVSEWKDHREKRQEMN